MAGKTECGGAPVRIAITGSSGLIGRALAQSLAADGVEVLRLVRRPAAGAGEVSWDPAAAGGGLDPAALDGGDAVVHLSGAPVAQGRWTTARKQELRASRIDSTQHLVAAILAAPSPPPVLLAASAIGWYGDTGSREVDEAAPAGTGFLADLVRDWEAAAQPAADAGIRVVHLRSGVVLSRAGGMLKPLLLLFRLGLGARIGPGTQYLSWIGIEDHVGACRFLLESQQLSGPVNLTAPNPVTNAEFTAALAAQVHRPALLRVPSALLQPALGELSGELLGSCRVRPARLEDAGFTFRHPHIGQALAAALQAPPAR
jgi:uncharacterized protein (TIGR01777 family)